MSRSGPGEKDGRMGTTDPIEDHASDLVGAAQRFRSAVQEPGCHVAAPEALASLEETLQVLSAAWYQLAADAAPGTELLGTLHEIAAAFARCARVCRQGRSTVTAIVSRAPDGYRPPAESALLPMVGTPSRRQA
jgi:hypothetical protein